ncbi:MAG: hypothetical protein J2P36_36520 [Ktedonobacteraceae bacterium]|nr:hypothetical protein [Ktedonobacteraceae bacterium]
MLTSVVASSRRPVSWMIFGCLAILVFALAACGGDATPTSNSASTSSNGNNSTNASAAKMTIAIKESKDSDGKDVYRFDPPSITVKMGDTVTVQNLSDELQDIDQGDAVAAGVDVVIPLNQSGTMTFNKAGTFTIKSEKGATLTVTVQ